MKVCKIKLKDGTQLVGYTWEWKPLVGYMTVAGVEGANGPIQVRFADVESGTTERSLKDKFEYEERGEKNLYGNPVEDVLEYARACGWKE